MDYEDDFVNYLIHVQEYNLRGPKRYLRDLQNPLELYDDEQFFSRYRFSKKIFTAEIFPLLEDSLDSVDLRGQPLPPVLKVLAVLRFYATGNYQIDTGDAHCMSQPTMCQLVKKISLLLVSKLPIFIKFPSPATMERVKRRFYSVAHFPDVIGCIDCTHIPIQNPRAGGGEHYRNRKGHFSLNVQIISGPNGEIFDIVARWPGSTHDSRIFENSRVKEKFEHKQIQGILLGDNGYAQTQYLFTPVLNPQEPAEERYNNSHTRTRCIVERLFDIWKRRFSCLRRQLANKVLTTTYIISACALLHNIAVKCKEELPLEDQEINLFENYDSEAPAQPIIHANRREAVIKRAFIAQHFT